MQPAEDDVRAVRDRGGADQEVAGQPQDRHHEGDLHEAHEPGGPHFDFKGDVHMTSTLREGGGVEPKEDVVRKVV